MNFWEKNFNDDFDTSHCLYNAECYVLVLIVIGLILILKKFIWSRTCSHPNSVALIFILTIFWLH